MENTKENIIPHPLTPDPPVQPAGDMKKPKVKEEEKKSWSLGKMFGSILDGTFLTKENVLRSIPFLFFIAFLGILYIANTYYAEKTVRAIDHNKRELKELRYEHITIKSELMYLSKQSEVAKRLEGTGLKITVTPPNKIFVKPSEIVTAGTKN
ncbi:MAG: FtsL-like putative cell division protein [Bacteroidetes bacterium]|nr:FtsL-like putative cell division protein [Bacteroidota bacterium]